MKILAIRTDKPEAELYVFENKNKLRSIKWQAHRQLAETIHIKIKEILDLLSISANDIQGIVCFKGPGSFTGLRIGLGVANALAYAQDIPIVARGGENWLEQGVSDLLDGKNDKIVVPEYGTAAKTTLPKTR
ncbi:MAG: tRNA (adenosine(37)-N6)-threonylcarbamoyltransferase complex dimerization subunit type 1 TsaB [Candidatus Saccharimonadales bacterium]